MPSSAYCLELSKDTATLTKICFLCLFASFLSSFFRREVDTDPDSGFETSDCSQSQLNDYNSVSQCGALSDSNGVFAACHETLPPQTYHE